MTFPTSLPPNWREVPLSEVADAVIGGTPSRTVTEYWNGNIPWATAKDVAAAKSRYLNEVQEFITDEGLKSSAAKLMPAGTVVITARGTVGALVQLRQETAFNQTCYALVPKDGLDKDFLRYALHGTLAEMRALTYGTVFETITRRTFDNWIMPLPPLAEQRAIAHVLGTLDDKIELNRRMNETLEGMARAIFQDWFVDFGPTRAKMEGRAPYLPPELWQLFPDRLVGSELGEIPVGWGVRGLGEVVEQRRSGADPVDIDPETPYIALEHMPRRSIALSEWDRADGVASNKFRFRRGDILFGKLRPYFHKVGVAPLDGVCSTDIVVITPNAHIWAAFALGHASTDQFVTYTDQTSTGTRMPRTSWRTMSQYQICLPPMRIASVFQDTVHPMVERIVAGIHESRALAGQRDALLPGLVAGSVGI